MSERLIETRAGLKASNDASALNGSLRRRFKGIKIDIEANEIFCEWLDGKTSVLTI